MSILATPQDVADRWRSLSPDEIALAAALLGDASSIVRAQYPGIDTQLSTDTSGLAQNVVTVVAGMVKRAMILGDNEGVRSETETTGPFSISRQYQSAANALALNDNDQLLILGYRPAGQSHPYGC